MMEILTKRFDEVFNLSLGRTPSRGDKSYWGGSNTWVSIADMSCGKYISSTKEGITDKAITETGIPLVKKGTVIMSFKLSIGKVCITQKALYTNEAIMAFTPNGKYDILPEYLFYYLQAYKWEGSNEVVLGFTLNKKTISQSLISFPKSLSEQQRIVDILDKEFAKIDALKANAEKNLQNAITLFQATLNNMLQAKKEWRFVRLNDLYNFIDYRGSTPTKLRGGIPLITAKNIKSGFLDYSVKDYISEEEYLQRQSRGVSHKGDILFTTEAPLGNVAIADKDIFSAGQRVITFQQYSTSNYKLNNSFYLYYFLSKRFQTELKKQATGLTAQGIKASRLKEMVVPVVDIQTQHTIVATLDELNAKCKVLQDNYTKTIALCDNLKQSLLRKAFNGEL